MKNCPKCGVDLNGSINFCQQCGLKLNLPLEKELTSIVSVSSVSEDKKANIFTIFDCISISCSLTVTSVLCVIFIKVLFFVKHIFS